MKMGGMQACDLVYEETNPEGQFFPLIFVIIVAYRENTA